MNEPLSGIRVVDLSHVLAGPFAAHQLRMLGAEVVKIEQPGSGDVMRDMARRPELNGLAPGFIGLNAGKRSLAVDLKQPAGRQVVEKLAATADVFIENFRPGKAAALGLDYPRLRALNPRLVYCSISGWGQTGPDAGRGAYDHVVQAATGMMMLQGSNDADPPVKVGFPVIDIGAGLAAATAILAALYRRDRRDAAEGAGEYLDVSMADASLLLMSSMVSHVLIGGERPGRVGNRGFVGSPGADTFPTADGWISTGANTRAQFAAMCGVLGRPDLPADSRFLPQDANGRGFLSNLASDALRAELCAAFAARDADTWERLLNDAGVPAARVRRLDEYLDGAYRQTGGITRPVQRPPGARAAQVLNAGFRRNGEAAPAPLAAATLGADTDAVLAELGYGTEAIAALRVAGAVA